MIYNGIRNQRNYFLFEINKYVEEINKLKRENEMLKERLKQHERLWYSQEHLIISFMALLTCLGCW